MHLRLNGLVFAVLTVLVAILGAWSGEPDLQRLWLLPLALLLLGLSYERFTVNRAKAGLTIDAPEQGLLGRAMPLQLLFHHALGRSVDIQVAPAAPEAIEIDTAIRLVSVPPGEAAALEVHATPRRLGQHEWPEMQARIAGPLGLAWWSQRLAGRYSCKVMPEMLRDAGGRMSSISGGLRPAHFNLGAGAEILQLREYRAGDPQNAIDWKATARRGRLISRDYTEDQHLDIVIAIDAGRTSALRAGELDRFGHYVNLAARFAEHAVANDDRVGVMLFADQPLATLAPGRGIGAVLRIRHMLAAATPKLAESNPLNAALRIRTLVRHRSLVVILTEVDDATVAGQLASAARLLLPKHLPLIAGISSPEAEAMRDAPAHTWLDPYESLAAQEYSSRLERNVRALRALGAPALVTRPEHMERAVFDAYAEFRKRRRV
ncbi:DUF58 domain-containing protein [Steroidobacter sp. S1-65]|uniref:DUF58 domain-containing protein n=1 Tax=Steroidobacter gossypii TaxID=2805490 RepID=A0ABS1WQA0_9GAMM|nr:DUF58 domain-containing protein [Steroidobacter gossypii]MBM0103150.1 DUF58 domain-containing protein [Steroidobacter gossypii]